MANEMEPVAVKRIYEKPERSDGTRILVDRLWPRGITKEAAQLSFWMKEVAPSPELRIWFDHDAGKFDEFSAKYAAELSGAALRPHLEQMMEYARNGRVTLLYAAKDRQCNHAVVLRQYVLSLLSSS